MTKKSSKSSVKSTQKRDQFASKESSVKTKVVQAEIVDSNVEESDLHFEDADNVDNTDHPYQDTKDYDESSSQSLIATHKDSIAPASRGNRALATADPMTLYLASIRKYPLLSKEDEHKLAMKYYETKDAEAAQVLVTSNLRFVVKIAAEYSKFGAKLIDLVQEGNVGLMHAVREFNPLKGVRLITYAVWWIRGYIQEYLMKQYSLVRIGTTQNQRKLFYQLQKQKEALDALGENPDYEKLSEKLNIPADEIQEMRGRLSGRDISLDRPLDENTKSTLGDMQKNALEKPLDEELATQQEVHLLKEQIKNLRDSLSEREKIILDERLLSDEPLTLQEIGEKYGITREAVRQMESRVMRKIKAKYLEATGEVDPEDEES